jgi:hypothetical protein
MTATSPKETMEISSKGGRAAATFASYLLAIAIYAVGLLSPLTPSYGTPSIFQLIVFWVFPMGLLASVWIWDHSVVGRLFATMLFLSILASYIWISHPMWSN